MMAISKSLLGAVARRLPERGRTYAGLTATGWLWGAYLAALLAIASLALAAPAAAQDRRGSTVRDLARDCVAFERYLAGDKLSALEMTRTIACIEYLNGFLEAVSVYTIILNKRFNIDWLCDDVSGSQFLAALMDYIRKHPEMSDRPRPVVPWIVWEASCEASD